MSRRPGARPAERGSATVETALVFPVVVLFILILLAAALAGSQQLAVTEGARAAARSLAIGESLAEARAAAARVCTCDAQIAAEGGDWVRVTVMSTSPTVSWIPGFNVAATITVPAEADTP